MENALYVGGFEMEQKIAMKISMVSIVGNILLSLFKALAGIVANSGAMISDAIHSASDVFSTIYRQMQHTDLCRQNIKRKS